MLSPLLPLLFPSHAALPLVEERTYDVDGTKRLATLIFPEKTDGPVPVVFGFHGHGGNRRNARRSFAIESHWPEAIVVYMEGLPTQTPNDRLGERNGWQVMPNGSGGRDLKFFDAVLADLQRKFEISPNRTFAMGHSNGGRFSYVLWAARADKFAAFGPSASPATGLQIKAKPAFIIAGETDQIVPFARQKQTIDRVAQLNGTSASKKTGTGHLTIYDSKVPLQTWIYPGDHKFESAAVPHMITFFKSVAK
jgi:polyhydroxybutyrate depolymerase